MERKIVSIFYSLVIVEMVLRDIGSFQDEQVLLIAQTDFLHLLQEEKHLLVEVQEDLAEVPEVQKEVLRVDLLAQYCNLHLMGELEKSVVVLQDEDSLGIQEVAHKSKMVVGLGEMMEEDLDQEFENVEAEVHLEEELRMQMLAEDH